MLDESSLKTLFDKSSGLIVQTPKEFLRSLNIDQFTNSDVSDLVKTVLSEIGTDEVVQIGAKSLMGKVYLIKKLNIVLKVSDLCDPNTKVGIIKKMCDIINEGSLIFKIPYTPTNETIVLVPNYLSEIVIGNLLELDTGKYTSGFMKILGYNIDIRNSKMPVSIFLEKLEEKNKFITSFSKFLYHIYGVLYALNIAQKTGRYVHFDLHGGNTMVRPVNKTSVYDLGNGNYFYAKAGFEPVIIDYGFSRYEKDGYILLPSYEFAMRVPDKNSNPREIVDFYAYNPYYDMFSVVYTHMLNYLNKQYSVPDLKPEFDTPHILNIYNTMLNKSFERLTKVNRYIENYILLRRDSWRPIPEVITNVNTSLCSIEKLLGAILDAIIKTENVSDDPLFYISPELKELKLSDSTVFYPSISQKGKPFLLYDNLTFDSIYQKIDSPKDNTLYDDFQPIIQIDTIKGIPDGIRDETKSFNHSSSIPYGTFIKNNMTIRTATINTDLGVSEGYRFNFECCRIDINDYFQNPKIQSGVAINATFFKLLDDFLPVGTYKTPKLYINDNEIPEMYKKFYAILAISEGEKLIVDTLDNYTKYSNFITSGPVLVKNGEIVMTEQVIENTVVNGEKIFQCSSRTIDASIHNCSNIKPGELWHSGNLNPRSALITLEDNSVIFVYVEGRSRYSYGMDLVQLAELCKWMGAKDAINLDGGRSSQLVWKKPEENIIYVSNSDNLRRYPVGSIISFTKSKEF